MKKRVKLWIAVLAAAGVAMGGFCYINASLRPVLRGLASARVESMAARAMNDAIWEAVGKDNDGSLIRVYANDGGVYLLQADSAKLNTLAASCAEAAQKRISELGEQGITVPIGTVSGIPVLAGWGPKLRLHFSPAGAVVSAFDSEFCSAGINQTRHRIYLSLTANVRVVLPGESDTLRVIAEATIAENIIVGDVPEAYTNVANEEDLLNLVPKA